MAFDAHANFATSLVATAPSPATSGTSLVVTAAGGALFPAVPFNAVIGPASTLLTPANAEIVRVTTVSTDTFTITRTQEGSSARTVVVGDQVYCGPTAKTFTDIQSAVTTETTRALAAEALGASDPLTPTGVTYQNFSRFANQTVTGALASGQMKVSAIWLPTGFTVTSISFLSSTALVLGTSPHFWFALFDSSGNLLRQTADQTAAAWAATTLKTVNLSSTFVTTYTGLHYLGVMVAQTGGTFPTLVAANVSTGAVSLAPILGGSGGDSGLTTTAPNPMAAINTGTNVVYCGVA